MEKTVFLFRRHKDRSRTDFARHYIANHAPLGARLTRCLLGYTVNLVEAERGPDAITEHWVPVATDLLDPAKAYATREDFEEVLTDDRTLFDGFELYAVIEEIYRIGGSPPDTPLAERTPETKLVWLYADAADAPPPPVAASRVVDNRVGYKLAFDGQAMASVAPDIQLIRMAWGPSAAMFGEAAADAIEVAEYRFIAAPRWPAATAR